MLDVNKVFLAGRLTRTPEIRYTANSTPVLNFSLAVSRRYSDRSGNKREDVVFVDVIVWGKQAESCSKYLQKGSPVFVEGRLQFDTWENKSGEKRNKISIVAQRVQFLPKSSRPSDQGDIEDIGVEEDINGEAIPEGDIPVNEANGSDDSIPF